MNRPEIACAPARARATSSDHPSTRSAMAFAPQVYRGHEDRVASNEIEALRIELRAEVRALRALVARSDPQRGLALELAQIRAALTEIAPASPTKRDAISTWLRARGVEGAAARRIATAAKKHDGDDALRAAIGDVVRFEPWATSGARRRIVSLVGPSGVGKTTTVAKLAARERMAGKSVALISCDGFRVGAVDQLERYAELLDGWFHVARSGAELARVIAAADEDVIFVDTSGRPPAEDGPETTLAALRKQKKELEITTVLCITANTRAADATRIAATYAAAAPTLACVTKTDETAAPSALLHAPLAAKVPLAIVCNGPRVPEDFEPATLDVVWSLVSGDVK